MIIKNINLLEEKNTNNNTNYCIAIIGTNRTGKSVTAREIAIKWREKNEGEIWAFDPQNRFQEIATNFVYMHDKDWCKKALKLKNGLLILDDYKLLPGLRKHQPSDEFAELIYFRAQRNVDIIYICHNPALLMNFITYFTSHYFIFYTESLDGSFERKIPNYILCKQASHLINDYVKHLGRGNYPNFPHIIVDAERQKIIGQNINHEEYLKLKNDNDQNN